jgi:hypothetical protein
MMAKKKAGGWSVGRGAFEISVILFATAEECEAAQSQGEQ